MLNDLLAGFDTCAQGIAALTSSSVLTKLGALTVPAAHFRALFPPGRLLPQLLELSLNDQIFVQHETLYTAAVNCSALTRLEVHAPCEISILTGQGVPPQAADVNRGLAQLGTLQHLQALHLEWCPLTVESWQTLASLPALKQLRVFDYELDTAKGLLEMTHCRALTNFVFELQPYQAWFGLQLGLQLQTRWVSAALGPHMMVVSIALCIGAAAMAHLHWRSCIGAATVASDCYWPGADPDDNCECSSMTQAENLLCCAPVLLLLLLMCHAGLSLFSRPLQAVPLTCGAVCRQQ